MKKFEPQRPLQKNDSKNHVNIKHIEVILESPKPKQIDNKNKFSNSDSERDLPNLNPKVVLPQIKTESPKTTPKKSTVDKLPEINGAVPKGINEDVLGVVDQENKTEPLKPEPPKPREDGPDRSALAAAAQDKRRPRSRMCSIM